MYGDGLKVFLEIQFCKAYPSIAPQSAVRPLEFFHSVMSLCSKRKSITFTAPSSAARIRLRPLSTVFDALCIKRLKDGKAAKTGDEKKSHAALAWHSSQKTLQGNGRRPDPGRTDDGAVHCNFSNFRCSLFSVISVANDFTEIKKTPK